MDLVLMVNPSGRHGPSQPGALGIVPRTSRLEGGNMSNVARTAAALALVAAVGCGGPQIKKEAPPECNGPTWTCFKSGVCPFTDMPDSLCAVGIAEQVASRNLGIQTASTRARTEMAAVLQSRVDGFTRAVQESVSKSSAGEDSVQKIGDLAQNVVQATLSGVSIPKTWIDPNGNVYYAMAQVDAKTFVNALKGLKEAKGLSEELREEINQRAEKIVDEWKAERPQ
jgi:hypothetical protein